MYEKKRQVYMQPKLGDPLVRLERSPNPYHWIFAIAGDDGFVKSPISALRCIPSEFYVLYVRCIPRDLRRLDLKLFTAVRRICGSARSA